MPAAVPFIATATATALAAAKVATALKIVGTVAIAYASQKISERQARSALKNAHRDAIRANVRSNIEPVPVIYGTVDHVPGAIVYQVAHGSPLYPDLVDDRGVLSTVVVWGEGEIWAYSNVYVNDIPYDDSRFDLSGGGSAVSVANYIGTDYQDADPYLVARCADATANPSIAGQWTTEHKLTGVAYSRISCGFDSRANVDTHIYNTDGIPTFTAHIIGKVCYDPRTGVTVATANPALIALDFLRNDIYGAAVPDDEIDFDSFADAAAWCDERQNGLNKRPTRWTCDMIVDPTDDLTANIAQIMASCRGALIYSGGQYRMFVDRPQPVVFALTEANLTGGWSITLDDLSTRVNRIKATFLNRAKNWQPDYVVIDDPAYRVEDGGELLEREIDLPGVTYDGRAYDLALWELRQSRLGVVVEVNALLEAMRCEVGDVVSLTHSVPGWAAKQFRVTTIALLNTDEVRLTLREYSDTVYSDQTSNADIPIGTTLANPLEMPRIDFVQCDKRKLVDADGTIRHEVLLKWIYRPEYFARWFEIQWIAGSASFPGVNVFVDPSKRIYQKVISADDTFWVNEATFYRGYVLTDGLSSDTQYALRMRARSTIGGSGEWSRNWLFTTLP